MLHIWSSAFFIFFVPCEPLVWCSCNVLGGCPAPSCCIKSFPVSHGHTRNITSDVQSFRGLDSRQRYFFFFPNEFPTGRRRHPRDISLCSASTPATMGIMFKRLAKPQITMSCFFHKYCFILWHTWNRAGVCDRIGRRNG